MKSGQRNLIYMLLLSLAMLFAMTFPEEALARRGGGFGGGRSFRSSRSSGWSSSKSKSSSAWSKKSKTISSTRGKTKMQTGLNKTQAKAFKQPKSDKALYKKAKQQGTVFKNRDAAKDAFNKKYGSQYTSKYDKQPNQRPNHIPETAEIDGKRYRVDYNPQYGGYGYMGAGGSWMMYSVVRDMAMMSLLMGHHGYYYGAPPMAGGGMFSGLMVIVIIVILAMIFRPRL